MAKKKDDMMSLENRIQVIREYLVLWQKFFTFFSDDMTGKTYTQKEEQQFMQIVSVLCLNQYKLQEMTRGFYKDAEKIPAVLSEAVSLEYLSKLQTASFSKLQIDWHTLFISMNKAMGKMINALPPKRLEEWQASQQAQAAPQQEA